MSLKRTNRKHCPRIRGACRHRNVWCRGFYSCPHISSGLRFLYTVSTTSESHWYTWKSTGRRLCWTSITISASLQLFYSWHFDDWHLLDKDMDQMDEIKKKNKNKHPQSDKGITCQHVAHLDAMVCPSSMNLTAERTKQKKTSPFQKHLNTSPGVLPIWNSIGQVNRSLSEFKVITLQKKVSS